ncbi:LPXTG cell wall anchor domain-containing protein [Enterococcus faecium]
MKKIVKGIVMLLVVVSLQVVINLTTDEVVVADTNQTELTLFIEKEETLEKVKVNDHSILPKTNDKNSIKFLQIGVIFCLIAISLFSFNILKYYY